MTEIDLCKLDISNYIKKSKVFGIDDYISTTMINGVEIVWKVKEYNTSTELIILSIGVDRWEPVELSGLPSGISEVQLLCKDNNIYVRNLACDVGSLDEITVTGQAHLFIISFNKELVVNVIGSNKTFGVLIDGDMASAIEIRLNGANGKKIEWAVGSDTVVISKDGELYTFSESDNMNFLWVSDRNKADILFRARKSHGIGNFGKFLGVLSSRKDIHTIEFLASGKIVGWGGRSEIRHELV